MFIKNPRGLKEKVQATQTTGQKRSKKDVRKAEVTEWAAGKRVDYVKELLKKGSYEKAEIQKVHRHSFESIIFKH